MAKELFLLIFSFSGLRALKRVGEPKKKKCNKLFQCSFDLFADPSELVLTRFDSEAEAVAWINHFLAPWKDADVIQLLTQDPAQHKKIEEAAKSVQTKPSKEEEAKIASSTTNMNLPAVLFDENIPNSADENFKSLGSFTMVAGLLQATAKRQTFVVSFF